MENSSAGSYKPDIHFPYNPTITFLGIYPQKFENLCPHKNFYVMLIVALVVIVIMWKQPKYSSVGE